MNEERRKNYNFGLVMGVIMLLATPLMHLAFGFGPLASGVASAIVAGVVANMLK